MIYSTKMTKESNADAIFKFTSRRQTHEVKLCYLY